MIDRSFDFTIQMIEQQRAFAHHLLKAGVPLAQAMEQATDSGAERPGGTGGASDATGRTTTPS